MAAQHDRRSHKPFLIDFNLHLHRPLHMGSFGHRRISWLHLSDCRALQNCAGAWHDSLRCRLWLRRRIGLSGNGRRRRFARTITTNDWNAADAGSRIADCADNRWLVSSARHRRDSIRVRCHRRMRRRKPCRRSIVSGDCLRRCRARRRWHGRRQHDVYFETVGQRRIEPEDRGYPCNRQHCAVNHRRQQHDSAGAPVVFLFR